MTATKTRKPRKVNPVRCEITVDRRMIYPCEILPAGLPARIALNGKPYVITATEDAYTFHTTGGRSHVVCRGTCSCEDFLYVREAIGEACKHILATEQMLEDGTL